MLYLALFAFDDDVQLTQALSLSSNDYRVKNSRKTRNGVLSSEKTLTAYFTISNISSISPSPGVHSLISGLHITDCASYPPSQEASVAVIVVEVLEVRVVSERVTTSTSSLFRDAGVGAGASLHGVDGVVPRRVHLVGVVERHLVRVPAQADRGLAVAEQVRRRVLVKRGKVPAVRVA